jgi:hypothetical protein
MSKPTAKTTPELVHAAILRDAVEIAERQALQENIGIRPRRQGRRFQAPPNRGLFTPDPTFGLVIRINHSGVIQMTSEEQKRARQIARSAVQQSLRKNQKIFSAMIFGLAKQGKNYFELYGAQRHG